MIDNVIGSTSFEKPPSGGFDPTAYHPGWGGYYQEPADIAAVIDDLIADGQTSIRYWARPYWRFGSAWNNWSNTIGDAMVAEAESHGFVVYLDPEHNFRNTDGDTVTQVNKGSWMQDLKTIGLRYNASQNVVLEIFNEQDNDLVSLANECIPYLRAQGVKLPIHVTFMWTQSNTVLNDPDNNYSIGRHFYPSQTCSNATHTTPTTLDHVAAEDYGGGYTVNKSMDSYFHRTDTAWYLQKCLSLGIPNGWVCTELGPGFDDARLNDPRPFGMAYMMRWLREAKEHGVTVTAYRIGNYAGHNKKALYKQKALDFFNESLYPA